MKNLGENPVKIPESYQISGRTPEAFPEGISLTISYLMAGRILENIAVKKPPRNFGGFLVIILGMYPWVSLKELYELSLEKFM